MNKFYPDILHDPHTISAEGEGKAESLQRACLEAGRKYIGRAEGRYKTAVGIYFRWDSERYFELDHNWHDYTDETIEDYYSKHCGGIDFDNTRRTEYLYSHGRIAWMADHFAIVVDNLRTRKRRLFLDVDMRIISSDVELLALGDKLLVASVNRKLYVQPRAVSLGAGTS